MMNITRRTIVLIIAAFIMAAPVNFNATALPLTTSGVVAQPSININSYFSMTRAQRGRSLQAAVVMDIPGGYHVNSNRPSGRYLIPTSLKLDPRDGISVGAVRYPRAMLRNFSFSETKLSVFEGRAVMRFNVAIPSNFPHGKLELKAKVRYQSCSDKECYAPVSRDVSLWIDVVNANESSQRTNRNIFGK
jgi:DsbC/DsbD-like thiol-disulfide interchange protein